MLVNFGGVIEEVMITLIVAILGLICRFVWKACKKREQSKVQLRVVADLASGDSCPPWAIMRYMVEIYNEGDRKAEIFSVQWKIGKHAFYLPFMPNSVRPPQVIEAGGNVQFFFQNADEVAYRWFLLEKAEELAKDKWQALRNIRRIKVVVKARGGWTKELPVGKKMIEELMWMYRTANDKLLTATAFGKLRTFLYSGTYFFIIHKRKRRWRYGVRAPE